MKKYELDFYDKCGCTTTREEKIIIEANSLDEARDKAYNLPQARRYDNLMVREYIEGLASYGVEIIGVSYFKGKTDSRYKQDIRLFFNAKSENDIRRYYVNNLMGKYSHTFTYRQGNELYDDLRKEGQDTMLGKIVEIYQIGQARAHLQTIGGK
jgi:hypothetical protein